jgi:hypothetical protein
MTEKSKSLSLRGVLPQHDEAISNGEPTVQVTSDAPKVPKEKGTAAPRNDGLASRSPAPPFVSPIGDRNPPVVETRISSKRWTERPKNSARRGPALRGKLFARLSEEFRLWNWNDDTVRDTPAIR